MKIDYPKWIREIEAEANKLYQIAFDYRDKAKHIRNQAQKRELFEKAAYYERIVKEKRREAVILRERLEKDKKK